MKILLINENHYFVGGAEKHFFQLKRELKKRGFEVYSLGFGNKNEVDTDINHTSKKGLETKIYSLKQIIEKFNIPKHSVLKVDCEGCEYDLLLNSSKNTLDYFDRIQIEYHYGYKNLVKKLKNSGFKVSYTWPRYSRNYESKNHDMFVGMIYASKVI